MIALFLSLVNYIKQPRLKSVKHIKPQTKLLIVLQTVIICVVIGVFLGIFSSILGLLGVYNPDMHAINKMFEDDSKASILFTAVILAPVLEEFFFRGPLTQINKKYFKVGFYTLAVLFGYIHIFNFEITPMVLLFSPILVLPQLVLGLIFGYIRVRFGLFYSMILHMCYNGVFIIPATLFMR